MPSPSPDAFVRVDIWVHGYVQRVGFRWWVRCRALELGLAGSATNKHDGRVHVVAEGPRSQCERLVELVKTGDTPGRVDLVVENYSTPRGGRNEFLIR
ncbi:MAG TPA: acylphosphatase [Corynebacteriales bacterium]|nr:acylphosphatase [Mycobacteriales bacterium]